MIMRRVLLFLSILLFVRPAVWAQSYSFDDVFAVEQTIMLQGTEEFPIQAPGDSYITGERIYLTDFQGNRVAVFDTTGALLKAVGRDGEGPGEFRMPLSIRPGQDGMLYVNERGNLRIQVLDESLSPAGIAAVGVQGDQLLPIFHEGEQHLIVIGLQRCGNARCLARLYDVEGNRVREIAPLNHTPVISTWKGAVHDDLLHTVNIYEGIVRRFDLEGNLHQTLRLSSPSARYIRAEEDPSLRPGPEADFRGLFQQPRSSIRGIFVHDGRIFVQMQNANRQDTSVEFFLDVYDVEAGNLLMHGVETPGVLEAVTDRFYFVEENHTGDVGQLTIRAAQFAR